MSRARSGHTDAPPLRRCLWFDPGARSRGFTLLELMAALAVGMLLMAIAVPTYRKTVQDQYTQACIRDLWKLAVGVESYKTAHDGKLPDSLDQVPTDANTDPWGHSYQYLNFNSGQPGVMGKIRKDHNLHPLNSEFDLYSVGPDGTSAAALTAKASRDDIIWARDGAFVGVASDY